MGAQVTNQGNAARTPLRNAAISGDVSTVRALLAHKTDLRATDRWGNTSLPVAAEMGCADVVRALLKARSDGQAKNATEQTALAVAESNCEEKAIVRFRR